MGDAPRHFTAGVGCGTYLPRMHLAECMRARGEIEQAIELLEHCLREHPRFIGSVLPYASALLADGLEPAAVIERLQRHMPNPVPSARFMLGTALYEAGASAAGEGQFRAVLACQPHSGRARVALAEALLAQRRYAEAASEAATLAQEDQLAVIARRTELFARIAGAIGDGTAIALERARAAGMERHEELDLFIGWEQSGHAAGRTEPIAPSREAVGQLTVMLEALLRTQHFDAFEVLLGLLAAHPPVRARTA